MWPPTLVCLFARTTIAMAFQRMYEWSLISMSGLPGYFGCWLAGMVLMYCVVAE